MNVENLFVSGETDRTKQLGMSTINYFMFMCKTYLALFVLTGLRMPVSFSNAQTGQAMMIFEQMVYLDRFLVR